LLLLLLLSLNSWRIQRTPWESRVRGTRRSHPVSHNPIRICHPVGPKRDLRLCGHWRRTHRLASSGRRSFARCGYRGRALAVVLGVRSICGLRCNLRGSKMTLRGHGIISIPYRALLHRAQTGLKVTLGALAWAVS
jgi:hypothetical protein